MKSMIRRLFRQASPTPNSHFEILLAGNPMGLNVMVFTEYINATYFISFDIPMRPMHASGKINLAVASQQLVQANGTGCWVRWADEFRPDIVVMTRYGQPHGAAILDSFRRRGVPVVYHIDDDLLEVPDSLGAEIRQRHGADDMIQARRYLLANCDLIYASTAYLATTLQARFPRQSVFHGIYAPYLGGSIAPTRSQATTHPVIGYMGSKGHQQDLDLAVPALIRLLEERPTLGFEVFGTIRMPAALECFGSRVRSRTVQKSYMEFLATLAGLGWDIGLAPLVDAPFNRCKAPTKFIEYTACGIPVLASRLPVYEDVIPENGGMLVDQDWYGPMVEHLDNPQQRQNAVLTSQQFCSSRYAPEVLQQQLIDVFKSVKRAPNETH